MLCLLDFFEDPDETANAIYSNLKNIIESANLSLKNMTCYSAHNVSVNFGRISLIFNSKCQCNCSGMPSNILSKYIFDIKTFVLKT